MIGYLLHGEGSLANKGDTSPALISGLVKGMFHTNSGMTALVCRIDSMGLEPAFVSEDFFILPHMFDFSGGVSLPRFIVPACCGHTG